MHSNGIASQLDVASQCSTAVEIAKELYCINRDIETKAYYIGMLQWYLYNISAIRKRRIEYSVRHLFLSHDIKKFLRNLTRR